MALPGKYTHSFTAGDRYTKTILLCNRSDNGVPTDPVDLTGASIKSQIRSTADSGEVLAEFVISNEDDLTTDGTIVLLLDESQTQPLVTGKPGPLVGVWDLRVTTAADGPRFRLAGSVVVKPSVTRD